MATTPTAADQLASVTQFVDVANPVDNLIWVRQAFMLNTIDNDDISDADYEVRIATTAAWKFVDTSLGGNWAINVIPGFTEYADVTMGGDRKWNNSPERTWRTVDDGYGIGRIYSEMFDDNMQTVTMSFGIKDFNSLTSFFGSFYSSRASQLVRTGRSTGAFFALGQITGALLSVPFMPLVAGSTLIKSIMNIPATKFSYFKPTMPLYWQAVNTILNGITANLGLHSRQLTPEQKKMYNDPLAAQVGVSSGSQVTATSGAVSDIEEEIKAMAKFLPGIYGEGGGIDVYAVAGRAQALADAHNAKLQEILDGAASVQDLQSKLTQALKGDGAGSNLTRTKPQYTSLSAALQAYLTSGGGKASDSAGATGEENMGYDASDDGVGPAAPAQGDTSGSATNTNTGVTNALGGDGSSTPTPAANPAGANTPANNGPGRVSRWFQQFWDGLKSDLHDGSGYITFRTDYGGTIGESFSSSMRESDLAQKINSMSSESRMTSYNMAGGHLVGGLAGAAIDAVVSSVKDVVGGLLEGAQLSGVAALAGAAYVDIPKMYDSSNATLPSQSFTIELRSWSGHRLALLQNIYLPLACLLAGALPRSTGPQSYNGPFSCQLFARGRMQVRDGLITDMSITRGTGNVGWSPEGLPLGIDVTFTVTDFSSVMHMPIIAQTGFYDKAAMAVGQAIGEAVGGEGGGEKGQQIAAATVSGMYSDDSLFSDYLAILAGLSWKDQLYPFRRWSIYRDKAALDWASFKSPYRTAGWVAGSLPGRLIQALVHGTDRP